jgi:hypothetical protein
VAYFKVLSWHSWDKVSKTTKPLRKVCPGRESKWASPEYNSRFSGFSLRRPGFASRSVRVGFVVAEVALGQVFPPNSSAFLCPYHCITAPYSPICHPRDGQRAR